MGESVSEATVISWTKEIGEMVEMDETIVEIATDKVDSEVPSTHEGKLVEKLFEADEVVQVGEPFAILEIEGGDENLEQTETASPVSDQTKVIEQEVTETIEKTTSSITNSGDRFYSPLVRSMASEEGIKMSELESIPGTGKDGRVTKTDMINYLKNRGESNDNPVKVEETKQSDTPVKTEETKQSDNLKSTKSTNQSSTPIPNTGEVEIVEMDRMRKLISAHMTMSKSDICTYYFYGRGRHD